MPDEDGSVEVAVRANLAELEADYKRAESLTLAAAKAMQGSMDGAQKAAAISAKQFAAALAATGNDLTQITPQLIDAGAAQTKLGNSADLSNRKMIQLGMSLRMVAQQLAMGVSPAQILVGQLDDLARIFSGRGGLAAAAAGIGAWLITPLGQVVVIAGAVTAAVVGIFVKEKAAAAAAERALKTHVDLVERIKDAYKDASSAATRYGAESLRVLQALDVVQEKIIRDQLKQKALDLTNPMGRYGVLSAAASEISPATFDALKKLRQEAATGAEDWKEFGENIVKALNDPDISSGQRKIAQGFLEIAAAQAKIQTQISPAVFGGDTNTQLRVSARHSEIESMKSELQYTLEQKAVMERIRQGFQEDLIAISAKSPAEIGAARAGQLQASRTDFSAAETLRIEQEAALAAAEAQYQLAEAERQREAGRSDAIESAQVELSLIGKSVSEQERLRQETQMLQAAKEAARQAGGIVSPEEVAQIKAAADALAQLAQAQALAQMRTDAIFDRQTMFLSDTEQNVAEQMRGVYGDAWQLHMNDAEATMLRLNDYLGTARDLTQDFASTFRSGLQEGRSVIDSLTDALASLQAKLLDMAMDQAINALFGAIASGVGGSLGSSVLPGGAPLGAGGIGAKSNVIPFRKGPALNTPASRAGGFMGGVSAVPNFIVHNHASNEVSVSRPRAASGGGFQIDVVKRQLKKELSQEFGLVKKSNKMVTA